MKKGSAPSFGKRKAQVFSLDNLIAMLLIIFVLGASLQYMLEVQNKMKFSASDYELRVIASDSADVLMKRSLHQGASINFSDLPDKPTADVRINCTELTENLGSAFGPNFPYSSGYLFNFTASEAGHEDQITCNIYEGNLTVNKTALSVRRFIYYHYDDGTGAGPDFEKPEILGVDTSIWRE